jgi:hypothetical protein
MHTSHNSYMHADFYRVAAPTPLGMFIPAFLLLCMHNVNLCGQRVVCTYEIHACMHIWNTCMYAHTKYMHVCTYEIHACEAYEIHACDMYTCDTYIHMCGAWYAHMKYMHVTGTHIRGYVWMKFHVYLHNTCMWGVWNKIIMCTCMCYGVAYTHSHTSAWV